jgi:hypothetical protein
VQVARYVSKLVGEVERQFETSISISKLLNRKNLLKVSSHANEGIGIYEDAFADDMALTRTVISFSVDSSGRPFYNLDVVVTRYNSADRELILELLRQRHTEKMAAAQNNGGDDLHNPLPEVEL